MWTLLRTIEEWKKYCHDMSQQIGISASVIDFGRGPQTYPCLVCSTALNSMKYVSAFVYPENALLLLKNCSLRELPPGLERSEPIAAHAAKEPKTIEVIPSGQNEFNLHLAADVLTLTWAIVELGAIKKETFTQKHIEFMAMLDQVKAESRDAIDLLLKQQELRDGILPAG